MEHTLIISSLEEIDAVAKEFLELTKGNTIFCFEGDLGAGKTTFIQSLCKQLNVIDEASSPTYSLVNEYKTGKAETIYHLDLYRLNDIEEAANIGIEEYLDSGAICFIEWYQIIEPLLPEKYVLVQLATEENNSRKMSIFTK